MDIITKTNISFNEKRRIIDVLFEKGCISIYLLYNIFRNTEKNIYFYSNDLDFFATFSKKTKELHLFSFNFNYIQIFKELLLIKGYRFSYFSGNHTSINYFLSISPDLSSKIIFSENYFFYKLKNNEVNQEKLKTFLSIYNSFDNIYFKIPVKKKDLLNLIELQTGYMVEEMNYPDKILNKKFILTKLLKIYKEFKLFYLSLNDFPVAKCEWNAYTHDIFQIGGVYTLPLYRKKGYSAYLLSKMILYSFFNLKYRYATLFVRRENYKAINLYEKLGFKKSKENLKWVIIKN